MPDDLVVGHSKSRVEKAPFGVLFSFRRVAFMRLWQCVITQVCRE